MDVDKDSFYKQLLPILQHIANATYVTFDLEMSGISTRPRYSAGDRSHDVVKPSLQQQYDEMRDAAQTFQILQVGITCVEEDRENDYYTARPYNFFLSPLSAQGTDLKLDRSFAFSSSACDFLKRNEFDFGKVFSVGVPYLSREEEHDLRNELAKRAEKNATIPELTIPPSDVSTLEFYRTSRSAITEWLEDTKHDTPFVNITGEVPLSAYQRRLVHQLVRMEFPSLRTFARNDGWFMQVEKLNKVKEAEFQKRQLDKFNSQIAKQKGLRWIFEALSNGDLSGINPTWFCDEKAADPEKELAAKRQELSDVIEAIENNSHVLVGHNLFTDLAFVYRTFFGTLSRSVNHFQEDVHEQFPNIIDTKYLATEGNDSNARSNLRELLQPFKTSHEPLIVLHHDHSSYGASHGKDHEAGFDSWMTAELVLKLSTKLYNETKHLLPDEERDTDMDSTSEDNEFSSEESGGALIRSRSASRHSSKDKDKDLPAEWYAREMNKNPFSLLADLKDDLPTVEEKRVREESRVHMPDMNNIFWEPYFNKLRVNASEGGVCDLREVA